jgi:hypothetical protein
MSGRVSHYTEKGIGGGVRRKCDKMLVDRDVEIERN